MSWLSPWWPWTVSLVFTASWSALLLWISLVPVWPLPSFSSEYCLLGWEIPHAAGIWSFLPKTHVGELSYCSCPPFSQIPGSLSQPEAPTDLKEILLPLRQLQPPEQWVLENGGLSERVVFAVVLIWNVCASLLHMGRRSSSVLHPLCKPQQGQDLGSKAWFDELALNPFLALLVGIGALSCNAEQCSPSMRHGDSTPALTSCGWSCFSLVRPCWFIPGQ